MGKVIERKVDAPEGIPTPEDLDRSSKKGFLDSFDAYEKVAIKARNQICEDITQEFLAEVSKKTARIPKCEKELFGGVRSRQDPCHCLWYTGIGPETQ